MHTRTYVRKTPVIYGKRDSLAKESIYSHYLYLEFPDGYLPLLHSSLSLYQNTNTPSLKKKPKKETPRNEKERKPSMRIH